LIRDGEILNAADLIASMERDVPGDGPFKAGFATESISSAPVVRYMLQCLQKATDGDEFPHLGEDDELRANLEHILPQSPDKKAWAISEVDHERLLTRLGNLTLLTPAVLDYRTALAPSGCGW
jgi:hypothetical protein